jgi:hypothetical protein
VYILRKRNKVVLGGFLVCISVVIGIFMISNIIENAYQMGVQDGYEEAVEEVGIPAYNIGYGDGYYMGFQDGYESGFIDGYVYGHPTQYYP